MAHKFVKQQDGWKVCEWCGDERGHDAERDCPQAMAVRGNNPVGTHIDFNVPAFERDFVSTDGFLETTLPAAVPLRNHVGYINQDEMDLGSYDRHITPAVIQWMDGTFGEGVHGLISRNDALFLVYQRLAHLGKFSRNKHEDSTVAVTRSDRNDMFEGIPLVKIEEKDNSLSEAVEDLHRKHRWLPHYSLLPFVFGMAVTQTDLEVYTLDSTDTLKKVFAANLVDDAGRWACVKAMVNIARTLKMFIEQKIVIPHALKFDCWHDRNNKRIRLDINFAEIEFKDVRVFERMKVFYNATATVPHLEHFVAASPFNEEKKRLRLVPVGVTTKPHTADELTSAVKQIVSCLLELHASKYVHCDVRWSNIIEYFGNWYLIDCEYACHVSEQDLPAMRSAVTIKRRFVMDASKPWDWRFDLYQVGLLLQDCEITLTDQLMGLRTLLLSKVFTLVAVKRAMSSL